MDDDQLRAALNEFPHGPPAWKQLPQWQETSTPEAISEILFMRCMDLIGYGLALTDRVLLAPGVVGDDDAVAEAASALRVQLAMLRVDVDQLYRQREDERAASASAFRAQADYVAARAAAYEAWTAIALRLGQLGEAVEDLRDRAGRFKDAAVDRAEALMTQASGTIGTLGQSLVNWLTKLGKSLWQLISKLLTPKEWSVSGEAGVNILGLQGSVTLEVTFGP